MQELLAELERVREKHVIVEGKNDRRSLEALGFHNVIMLDHPLYKVVEDFKGKEVIILTDLDKEGKKLYSMLSKEFYKRGVKVDDKLRKLLFKTKLRQIEGLANYLSRNMVLW